MKNKIRLVRIAKKVSKTILHRGFTASIKKHTEDNKAQDMQKTVKLTRKNASIRNAIAIY